jgi:hypothetical protein
VFRRRLKPIASWLHPFLQLPTLAQAPASPSSSVTLDSKGLDLEGPQHMEEVDTLTHNNHLEESESTMDTSLDHNPKLVEHPGKRCCVSGRFLY